MVTAIKRSYFYINDILLISSIFMSRLNPGKKTAFSRSHALRGNAACNAPRPLRPGWKTTLSVKDGIPTEDRGNENFAIHYSGFKTELPF